MQSKRLEQTARNGRALGIARLVLLLLMMAAATSTTAIAAMAAGPPQNEAATVLGCQDLAAVDAANSIRVFGGWTLQIQMGPFQV